MDLTSGPVWDLPLRLLHWSLPTLVAACRISRWWGDVELHTHRWCGYTLLTLLPFRLLWGWWGEHNARFGTFLKGSRSVLRHVREGGFLILLDLDRVFSDDELAVVRQAERLAPTTDWPSPSGRPPPDAPLPPLERPARSPTNRSLDEAQRNPGLPNERCLFPTRLPGRE